MRAREELQAAVMGLQIARRGSLNGGVVLRFLVYNFDA